MRITAIKLTEDIDTVRVLYEKGDKKYIRSGADHFETGTPMQGADVSPLTKWGFRTVENPPEFRDASEIKNSVSKFHIQNTGTVKYLSLIHI